MRVRTIGINSLGENITFKVWGGQARHNMPGVKKQGFAAEQ